MPLQTPILYWTEDGFRTELVEQPDGGMLVTVTAPSGRMWAAGRATVEAAAALAYQIRIEQGAKMEPLELLESGIESAVTAV